MKRYTVVFVFVLHGIITRAQQQAVNFDPATYSNNQQQYEYPVVQPQEQYETQAEQPQIEQPEQPQNIFLQPQIVPHQIALQPQIVLQPQYEDEQPTGEEHLDETDEALNYKYGFQVNDPDTNNFQERREVREKGVIRGYYSLVEPDGSIRLVTYTADKTGFRAMVARKVQQLQQEDHSSLLADDQ